MKSSKEREKNMQKRGGGRWNVFLPKYILLEKYISSLISWFFSSYVLETLANIFCPEEFEEEVIPDKQRDDFTGTVARVFIWTRPVHSPWGGGGDQKCPKIREN